MPGLRATCIKCEAVLKKGKTMCHECGHMNLGATRGGNDGTELLSQATAIQTHERYKTGLIDDILGGGLVHTSCILIGGAPGAGKSTISLQLLSGIASGADGETLYIATEQPNSEVKLMAERLKIPNMHQIRMFNLMQDTNSVLDEILEHYKPKGIILDSLNGLVGDDMREAVNVANSLKSFSGKYRIPSVIISQINKSEEFAGLMSLQHAVDALILFTIRPDGKRIVEIPEKNRFGPTPVETTLLMTEHGLEIDPDPEGILGAEDEEDEGEEEDEEDEDEDEDVQVVVRAPLERGRRR